MKSICHGDKKCLTAFQTAWIYGKGGILLYVAQTNFDEFPGFSWLFEEISLRTKFPRTFEAPIVLVRRNYERYFAVDASELRTQEGKFILLESSVRNFERKFALLIAAKCSPRIVVMHCRNIRNHSHPFKQLFNRCFLLKPQ